MFLRVLFPTIFYIYGSLENFWQTNFIIRTNCRLPVLTFLGQRTMVLVRFYLGASNSAGYSVRLYYLRRPHQTKRYNVPISTWRIIRQKARDGPRRQWKVGQVQSWIRSGANVTSKMHGIGIQMADTLLHLDQARGRRTRRILLVSIEKVLAPGKEIKARPRID